MKRRISADTLAVTLLMTIFLFTAAALLLFGLQVYREMGERMEENYTVSTPLAYLAARVRQHEDVDVSVFPDGTTALLLRTEYAGEEFHTRIYYYNGALCELFTPADVLLEPRDGEKLLETAPVTFTQQDGLLSVTCDEGAGANGRLLITPRLTQWEVGQ